MVDGRQATKDIKIGESIRSGPFMRDVRQSIAQINFAPDLASYSAGLPSQGNGVEDLSVVDFDGVVVDTTLLGFAGQLLGAIPGVEAKDFNHITPDAREAILRLKERGPVILTTNRLPVFNWLIEKCGATTEKEIIADLAVPPFADALDRQDPLRNRSGKLLDRIQTAVKASGGFSPQARQRILRLVFDINDGPMTWINSVSTNLGMPLELNSVVKIRDACKKMGIQFDEVHLGIIDPKLKGEP